MTWTESTIECIDECGFVSDNEDLFHPVRDGRRCNTCHNERIMEMAEDATWGDREAEAYEDWLTERNG